MKNYIIIGVIAVIVIIAVISSVKHFKGEGGCCGGGSSYKPKKKKLSGIRYQKTFKIDGMHCEHCKNRVEEIINDIPGIAGKVDLKKGELVVSYAKDVDDDILKSCLEIAGYSIESIKKNQIINIHRIFYKALDNFRVWWYNNKNIWSPEVGRRNVRGS